MHSKNYNNKQVTKNSKIPVLIAGVFLIENSINI